MSRSQTHAVAAGHVFDGAVLQPGAAVVVDGAQIVSVVPRSQLPAGMSIRELPDGTWIAPGFVDLQVNGGADVLFNDEPTAAGIAAIAAAHRKFGTTSLLPTLISDTPAKMKAALEAVDASADLQPSVLGLHLEGPFISPLKAGIHDPRFIREPTPDDESVLCRPRKGKLLLTLAPEAVPPGFIRRLAHAGVRVSLGHSMATYAQTKAAMADGLTGFTHLFNAMRPLASRDPGPIAAALESTDAWYGLIADGVHVDPAILRLAVRGAGHAMLVTDAMPPVGGRRSSFVLHGQEIRVERGRATNAEGTLGGAILTMADAVRNCVELAEAALTDALKFASLHPAKFMGLGDRLGRLAPGYRADIVAFEPASLNVLETWVAGAPSDRSAGLVARAGGI
jgi:N-acetylglucosamine-6-phosphate deacetylase